MPIDNLKFSFGLQDQTSENQPKKISFNKLNVHSSTRLPYVCIYYIVPYSHGAIELEQYTCWNIFPLKGQFQNISNLNLVTIEIFFNLKKNVMSSFVGFVFTYTFGGGKFIV